MGNKADKLFPLARSEPDEVVPQYCTIEMIATRLCVDSSTVERELAVFDATKGRDGLGPRYKFGRQVRVPCRAVNAYIERHRV